jgi:predicted phage tail component-like protein
VGTFSFNGVEVADLEIAHSFSISPFSEVENGFQVIPGRHGAHLTAQRRRSRFISVPFIMRHDGFEDLKIKKERLAELLLHREPRSLIFSDEPDRVFYAVVDGESRLTEHLNHAQGTITFLCPDPHKYALELITTSSSVINNGGTADTPLLLTVNFATNQNGFEVTHWQQQARVRINWNFVNGDILEIDMDKRVARINGINQMAAIDWNSQFFKLNTGINDIRHNSGNISITYRERWI